MDRSDAYSSLILRTRLRTCMAIVLAVGTVVASVLFMLAWNPGQIHAPGNAVPQSAQPRLATDTLDGHARSLRPIYPHSIVPGGVSGQAELQRVIRTDRVVAVHFAGFDVDKARPVVVDKPRAVHVSYRRGDKVYWTARKVMLAEGETLLSDGRNALRARCANRISDVPQLPVEADPPSLEELDTPVENEEGEQPPDTLPVSMDLGAELGPHVLQSYAIQIGGGAATSSVPGSNPADILLTSNDFIPVASVPGPLPTIAFTNTSSTSSLPPPPSTPSKPGSPGNPPPVPGTPGTPTTLPPSDSPPRSEDPAPTPRPTPLPGPNPGTEPKPVPSAQPGKKDPDGLPPKPPVDNPLLPPPGPGPQPFIPKPGPAPQPDTVPKQPRPPTEVPEPGSIWLATAGIAALLAARRRCRTRARA